MSASGVGLADAVATTSSGRSVHVARRARAQLAAACAAAIRLASRPGTLSCAATDATIIGSASTAMSDHRISPAAEPSPETVRQYLAAHAQRELDALHAELDVRLSALEAALAHPDPRTSLEDLVLDLARVATAEAESATARASLAAQLHVQERAAVAASTVQRSLEAERAITKTLRLELEQAQTALDVEREAAARLRQEFDRVRKSLEQERVAGVEAVRELDRARTALQDALEAGVAPRRRVAELEQALQNECERSAALDSELTRQRDLVAQTSQALAALQRELAAIQRAVDTHAADDAAHRAAVDTLEQRCAELDRQYRAALERASDAVRERHALAAVLKTTREEVAAAQAVVEMRAAAVDAERVNAERDWKDAEARAEKASAERDALAALLESAKKSVQGMWDAVEGRLAAIEAKRTRIVKALEEAEARAGAATRERDALATELDAVRQTTTQPDAEIARRLESATEQIRVLKLQLFERDRGPRDRDVDLGSALDTTASPPSDQAGQRAKRYGFPARTKVHIGREAGVLVDLSVTGAQVILASSPEVGLIVTVTLPSDETPCFCQGRLLWARREKPSKGRPLQYRVGLVFTAVDEAAIQAFIRRHSVS